MRFGKTLFLDNTISKYSNFDFEFGKPNTAFSLFEHSLVRAVIGNAFGMHLSTNNCADSMMIWSARS